VTERESKREPPEDLGKLAGEVAGGAAGAGLGLVVAGPVGALLGAVAPPLVSRALAAVRETYARRQEERVSAVIALAAKLANADPEEVVEDLQADPAREELLVRTLRTAQDAALVEKLVFLAVALIEGREAGSSDRLTFETALVRVVDDCDSAHFEVLDLFVQSANSLGLGDGSEEFEKVPDGLNRTQLDRARPALAPLFDSLLAVLERHGLASSTTEVGGLTSSLGPANVHWRITQFGRDVLERLAVVHEILRPVRGEGE
jgi:hypothetical protein